MNMYDKLNALDVLHVINLNGVIATVVAKEEFTAAIEIVFRTGVKHEGCTIRNDYFSVYLNKATKQVIHEDGYSIH